MTSQNRIILFCYAYVIGIALALAAPFDPAFLPWLRIATGIGFAASASVYARRISKGGLSSLSRTLEIVLLVVPALLFGCTRYTGANTVPDTRIGVLPLSAGRAGFQLERDLPDLCRVSIRKTQPLKADLVLRLQGEVNARMPVLAADGTVEMDAHGRWKFRMARLDRQSETIIVRASDPVGTDYVVPQPFSRLSKIDVVEGPLEGSIEIFRVSNHISTFARPGRDHAPVTILGRITQDPNVYDFKTVLAVTPDFVQYTAAGPYFKVEGGDVHIVLKPEIVGYEKFAQTAAYGRSIQAFGELSMARAAMNPGGFDPRRFMQNHNVYGVMNPFQPRDAASPVHMVNPEEGPTRRGSALVRFSLDLRDRMLRVFKVTMPYPQSAFLGGVTLGLRYGLHGVVCLLGHGQVRSSRGELEEGGKPVDLCEEPIAEEFKAAGVNHVLAVSGLHVTIITVMFIGIFSLMRIPRQMYVPLIILILIIFAIITGARPSVLRAVIMHGLFLLTWAYLDQGLRSSVLLGVPVAAFLILLQNPLVIVAPSFTLSFGAILSLGLLTEPASNLLSLLRGNRFLAFVLIVSSATLVGVLHWPLLVSPAFFIPFAILCALGSWLLSALEDRGIRLIGSFGYSNIPPMVGAFLAAQFAIQVGMMIPLSAYYFSRWPFAGGYANLIAIPLIGVVVQLGAMAGLLGLIPGAGLYIALVLNAANWVFSTMFLMLSHYFAVAFPFPFVRRPSIRFLAVYYILCAAFIWYKPIWTSIKRTCGRWGWTKRWAPAGVAAGLLVAVTLPLWPWGGREPDRSMRITFLAMGYGESTLIETPGGRKILVDTGFVEHERGRNNDAIRTILPFLAHKGIRKLDALILTSPAPERMAGAAHLLANCWVDEVFVPPALGNLSSTMNPEEFYMALARGESVENYPPPWLKMIYEEVIGHPSLTRRLSFAKELEKRGPTLPNRLAGWDLNIRSLEQGAVILRETAGRGEFRIEVLHPSSNVIAEHPIENGSAVLRVVYGRVSVLFCGDLHFAGQAQLASDTPSERLRSSIIVMPHHGTAAPWGAAEQTKDRVLDRLEVKTGRLLDEVRPERAIFCYGNPRPVLGRQARDAERVFELTWRYMTDALGEASCLRTDRDLAIFVESDGTAYRISTQAEANRAAGADSGIEDISVGF
jgi:ComEC/Rec2-related protein